MSKAKSEAEEIRKALYDHVRYRGVLSKSEFIAKALTDKFRIIPKEDNPEKWVALDCGNEKPIEIVRRFHGLKLKWRE